MITYLFDVFITARDGTVTEHINTDFTRVMSLAAMQLRAPDHIREVKIQPHLSQIHPPAHTSRRVEEVDSL